jgi:hypothetical protein
MTLREIINNLDPTKRTNWVDLSAFAYDLNIQGDWTYYIEEVEGGSRCSSQMFQNWMCTDTPVGGTAYFYDDVLCCVSYQSARKSDEQYYWVSEYMALKVRTYIESCKPDEEPNYSIMDIGDLDAEMGMGFHLSYAEQLMSDIVIVKDTGEEVKVTKRYGYRNDHGDHHTTWNHVDVLFDNGEAKTMDLETELLVPYNKKE